MLVLTRRIGEEIVIGNDIRVTVLAVRGQQVRLGIAAPLSVHVAREELLEEYARRSALAKASEKPPGPDSGT